MFALNSVEWTQIAAIAIFVLGAILWLTSNDPNHTNFSRYAAATVAVGLAVFVLSFIVNP
jgi:hypothetical protein